ncbi:MAG: hypothetical protein JXJ30_10805 [Halothiobacillaceae bacterium]|nr:hypothetical protein [Halothiobacillaceae bacterium]HER34173.1 hypothetical protein [Halothiobacillaceae bacterium]
MASTDPTRAPRRDNRVAPLGALGLPDQQTRRHAGCLGIIPLTRLGGDRAADIEAFGVEPTVETRQEAGLCLARSTDFSFGVIELDEGNGLAAGTEAAYRRLFETLDPSPSPQLWRVWQYLPGINAIDPRTGLERYRLFNQGRAAAFDSAGHEVTTRSPAACALGCQPGERGRLIFLAAASPCLAIENPRQISAYHYPSDYGPQSPIFARAAMGHGVVHDWLFISGTASIVGHASQHPGDVRGQTDETLANLVAVLDTANTRQPRRARPFAFDRRTVLRVYLRDPGDLEAVRDRLAIGLEAPVAILFLQADICRSELLVEIEATLRQPRDGQPWEGDEPTIRDDGPWVPL